jgi:acyl carrier protein
MTDDDAIRHDVRALVGAMSPHDDVTAADPTQRLDTDLDYDSLGKMELAIALERTFGLTAIQEEDVMDIDTVQDIEDLVIRVLGRQPA